MREPPSAHIYSWPASRPTRICAPGAAHPGQPTPICAPGSAHLGLPTRICTPRSAHLGLPTRICASRSAHLVSPNCSYCHFQMAYLVPWFSCWCTGILGKINERKLELRSLRIYNRLLKANAQNAESVEAAPWEDQADPPRQRQVGRDQRDTQSRVSAPARPVARDRKAG